MVRVVRASGFAVGANTALDLSPFLEDNIARLIGVRHLSRGNQSFASHTHPLVTIGGAAISGAGHTHLGTATGGGGHTVVGVTQAVRAVQGNGLLDPTLTALGGGSVALTGRKQLHMGNAISAPDTLEVRVLYFKEAAGVFY